MTEVNAQETPRLVVAVDGPSGSGKSSVSKEVARRLGAAYLDTGAMYRAVAWHCANSQVDLTDPEAVLAAAQGIELVISVDPDAERVVVGTEDITQAIREPEVTAVVSTVATNMPVRQVLVERQRQMMDTHRRIVAEGRDITTVVAPDADARVLLTASAEARMARRGIQLGGTVGERDLKEQISGRDAKDSTVVDFMTPAEGVGLVDSTELDLEQTVTAMLGEIERQAGAAVGNPLEGNAAATGQNDLTDSEGRAE